MAQEHGNGMVDHWGEQEFLVGSLVTSSQSTIQRSPEASNQGLQDPDYLTQVSLELEQMDWLVVPEDQTGTALH